MNLRSLCGVLAALVPAGLNAQRATPPQIAAALVEFSPAATSRSVENLPVPGRAQKSPWLAGALSFAIPFGTGSFYVGNKPHGYRHLFIGSSSAVVFLLFSGRKNCSLGDVNCQQSTGRDNILYAFGAVFVANMIWGAITAVDDARTSNAVVRLNAIDLGPRIVALRSSVPWPALGCNTRSSRIGLEVLRAAF